MVTAKAAAMMAKNEAIKSTTASIAAPSAAIMTIEPVFKKCVYYTGEDKLFKTMM
jgi:mitochondrial fission protein ELM1